jgi:IS4 transposase
LCSHFGQDDLLIADRAYGSYELIALLLGRGTQSVMRLHQKREGKIDWRQGKKIDANSRLITWTKPPRPGKCGITQEEWAALPETMRLRLVRAKGKDRAGKIRSIYIVTTLTSAEKYPTEEIALLYAERWKIEVKFRDIKTTMGLELLRVKSPEMARKSMRMACVCYNLVKALQMEALVGQPYVMDEIGFKGTLDVINEFRGQFSPGPVVDR